MTTKAPDHGRLVIALGGALLCSLLVIAFLLGRLTSRPPTPTVANPPPVSEPRADADRASATSRPAPGSAPVSISTPAPAPAEAIEQALTRLGSVVPNAVEAIPAFPPFASTPAPSPSADRLAVDAYLARIEEINDVGSGDPQAFATSMLQSVASGDFSGFDDLLSRARRQQERLLNITPPRSCVDHHRLALTLSADSVRILENIRGALTRGDSAALMSIAAEGGDLQTRANQLKAMGEALKRPGGR